MWRSFSFNSFSCDNKSLLYFLYASNSWKSVTWYKFTTKNTQQHTFDIEYVPSPLWQIERKNYSKAFQSLADHLHISAYLFCFLDSILKLQYSQVCIHCRRFFFKPKRMKNVDYFKLCDVADWVKWLCIEFIPFFCFLFRIFCLLHLLFQLLNFLLLFL